MSDSPTHRRVMNMLARGRLSSVDDANGMQFAQVSLLRDEAKVKVERFQQYGFSSVPQAGSEALTLFVGGNRDHGVIVSIDNRASRIRGQAAGEVALYTDEGDYIALKRGNSIDVTTFRLVVRADVEVVIEAPKVTITAPEIIVEGDLRVAGNIVAGGGNMTMTGNLHVTGNIDATGSINAPGGSVGP